MTVYIRVLEELSKKEFLSIQQLVNNVGNPANSIRNTLFTLKSRGFVEPEPGFPHGVYHITLEGQNELQSRKSRKNKGTIKIEST